MHNELKFTCIKNNDDIKFDVWVILNKGVYFNQYELWCIDKIISFLTRDLKFEFQVWIFFFIKCVTLSSARIKKRGIIF